MNFKGVLISFISVLNKFCSKKLFMNNSSNLILITITAGLFSGVINQEMANSILILLQGLSTVEIVSCVFLCYFLWFIHGILKAFRNYLIIKIESNQEQQQNDK